MKETTEYKRVIPRDLFNEAKLLKCIGQVCLNILDNKTPVEMKIYSDQEPFDIQLMKDGSLIVMNVEISIKNKFYIFSTTYNSKANYPLYVEFNDIDYEVFNDDGTWSEDFINFCKNIAK